MSFLKGTFFLFFPAVLVLYHALPGRFRALWLLLCSLCFYCLVNPAFVPVLLCYIAFTFGAGLLLEKHRTASQAESGAGSDTESGIQSKAGGAGSAAERRAGTALLAACLVALFSILLVFKYLPKGPFLIMPAGLSFFTFEAAGYLIDVYKGREAEKNPVPERIAREMNERHLCIRVADALILSEPDEPCLSIFHPDEALLSLLRLLAAGEGLYVWQP